MDSGVAVIRLSIHDPY